MRLIAVLFALLVSVSAHAQLLPSGPLVPGHALRVLGNNTVGDAGGAAGSSKQGQGYLTELGITNTGTPVCINDALINAQGGYHQLCFGANSLGGGLITYNAYGGAAQLGLNININGTLYGFPASGGGTGNMVGPNSSVVGNIGVFNNTSGTLMADRSDNPIIRSTGTVTTQPLFDIHDYNQAAGGGYAMRWWAKDTNGSQILGAVINGGMADNTAGATKGDIDFVAYGPSASVLFCMGASGVYAGLTPCSDNTYELGDSTLRWSKGWFGTSLNVGTTTSLNTLTVQSATGATVTNGTNGAIELVPQTSVYEALKWYGNKTFALTFDTNTSHVGNGSTGTVVLTADTNGNVALNGGYFAPTTVTTAQLPSCTGAIRGGMFVVLDANSPTYNGVLSGSGTSVVPVICDGTNWRTH